MNVCLLCDSPWCVCVVCEQNAVAPPCAIGVQSVLSAGRPPCRSWCLSRVCARRAACSCDRVRLSSARTVGCWRLLRESNSCTYFFRTWLATAPFLYHLRSCTGADDSWRSLSCIRGSLQGAFTLAATDVCPAGAAIRHTQRARTLQGVSGATPVASGAAPVLHRSARQT